MKNILPVYCLLLPALLLTCQPREAETKSKAEQISPLPSPAGPNSEEPNLFTSQAGEVYLSWIEKKPNKAHDLRFSRLTAGGWSPSALIASGSDWFVNWADFPALAAHDDGHMIAHILAKSGTGTYAYDVKTVQSFDGGASWNAPTILHNDETETEHGFVSMLAGKNGGFFLAWLDGRNTGGGETVSDDGHGAGAMTIRAAFIDATGAKQQEQELDTRVCDCCQTGAAMTANGPVVVYRDRSEDEIRDIAFVRYEQGAWTQPKIIYQDNWQIAGCPVNGPKADAMGNQLAVAWFSAANESPQVKVIFSADGGATFGAPVRIDHGKPLGRVDLVLLARERAMVSWLESTENGAVILAAEVNAADTVSDAQQIAETQSSRASGFPQMTRSKEGIVFAWTEVDVIRRIRTAMLSHSFSFQKRQKPHLD